MCSIKRKRTPLQFSLMAAGAYSAVLSGFAVTPARAEAPDANLFAASFGEVCIPERLSYQGTLDLAEQLGWEPVAPGQDAEIDNFLDHARILLEEEAGEDDFTFESDIAVFLRDVGGRRTLLVVDFFLSEYIDLTGCYLYDFAATEAIDAAPVTELLGLPISYTTHGGDPVYAADPALLVTTVWGPPPALPRTLDTYLTFIPEGSPAAEQTGFTGLVLKFSTSLPEEGEP